MGANTKIEWADHTFNPWIGCSEVSEACDHCYAKKLATRMRDGTNLWGPEGERRVTSAAYWAKPLRWAAEASAAGQRQRVFCASLADVFEDRPDLVEPRQRLWRLILDTPELDWLLLTKRPENVCRMVPIAWLTWDEDRARHGEVPRRAEWPAHVWLGTTVENQERAAERIPHLLRAPAPVHFISAEPLLEPLDVSRWILGGPSVATKRVVNCPACEGLGSLAVWDWNVVIDGRACTRCEGIGAVMGVDWIIAGGESGPAARPSHPDWFCALRDQCLVSGVAFHFKQWGEWSPDGPVDARAVMMADDGTVYAQTTTFSSIRACHLHLTVMLRVGKRAAGRELDGRTWDEVPTTPAVLA